MAGRDFYMNAYVDTPDGWKLVSRTPLSDDQIETFVGPDNATEEE